MNKLIALFKNFLFDRFYLKNFVNNIIKKEIEFLRLMFFIINLRLRFVKSAIDNKIHFNFF